MSLREEGGEEECFEYDCQDEERKLVLEQQDTLDLAEEGKFLLCTNLVLSLFVSRAAWLGHRAHSAFIFVLSYNVRHSRACVVSGSVTPM